MEYTTDVAGNLKFLNERPGIIVRILLENSLAPFGSDGDLQYDWFRLTFADFEHKYSNIKFVNGRAKDGWVKLVGIADEPPGYKEYVSSGARPKPKKYAETNNKYLKVHINYCTWSAYDFIDIDLDLEPRK